MHTNEIIAVSVVEAARRLGVSKGTIKNLITRGELPSTKLLGRRVIRVKDLESLVETAEGPNGR